MSELVLHIGLHKTGTTSIQHALTSSAEPLAEHGVGIAGGDRRDVVWGVDDLLGRRFNKDDAAGQSGAWQRLVDGLERASASQVVLSEELLSLARPRQIRRLGKSLHGHRLHLVVGLRDLARTLPSAWQQEVVQGRTYSWRDFVASIRGDSDAPASAGVAFWLRFDALRILDQWEEIVPRERIHLLTVPPPGTAHEVLLDRFADVLGVPTGVLRDPSPERNRSLGAVEVEVLRRLNGRLRLTSAQYSLLVNTAIRPALLRGTTRPLRLPPGQYEWVSEQSGTMVAELGERGYRVHGDLAELVPPPRGGEERRLDEVTDHELLAASEACLVGLAGARVRSERRLERAGAAGAGETAAGADDRGEDTLPPRPGPPLTEPMQEVLRRLADGLAASPMPPPRQRRALRLAEHELTTRTRKLQLDPASDAAAGIPPDESGALLPATEAAADALSAAYVGVRTREVVNEGTDDGVPWHGRLASSVRAAGFGMRVSALERADRNAALGFLARRYRRRLER